MIIILHYLAIFVALISQSSANTNSAELNQLKTEIQTLKNEVTQLRSMKTRIDYLELEKETQNGICGIKNQPCGDCMCIEDYNVLAKFFCDCRARSVRRDCKEHYEQGERINGLYIINKNIFGRRLQVYCDQTTDGGGWTVIQRRMDGSQNFYRNWAEYKEGFGQLHREHWLGNEYIFLLTAQAFLKGSEVRIDMLGKGKSNMRKTAKYANFEVDNETTGYRLHVSGYTGNVNDGLKYHDGMKFSTYDRDNDKDPSVDCTKRDLGGWWYNACTHANLNGHYDRFEKETNVYNAFSWYNYRLTFSEMKVRRK